MKKILVYSSIDITDDDGVETNFKTYTHADMDKSDSPSIQGLLDMHNEKVGALERKVLKLS